MCQNIKSISLNKLDKSKILILKLGAGGGGEVVYLVFSLFILLCGVDGLRSFRLFGARNMENKYCHLY
jgi:hypothetical protein